MEEYARRKWPPITLTGAKANRADELFHLSLDGWVGYREHLDTIDGARGSDLRVNECFADYERVLIRGCDLHECFAHGRGVHGQRTDIRNVLLRRIRAPEQCGTWDGRGSQT